MFRGITRIHFVGIGGIGMSGIAELLLNLGFTITGSDVADSDAVQRLRSMGAAIHIGHKGQNIGHAQVVVYSSAVGLDNTECVAAKAGARIWVRIINAMRGLSGKPVAVCDVTLVSGSRSVPFQFCTAKRPHGVLQHFGDRWANSTSRPHQNHYPLLHQRGLRWR